MGRKKGKGKEKTEQKKKKKKKNKKKKNLKIIVWCQVGKNLDPVIKMAFHFFIEPLLGKNLLEGFLQLVLVEIFQVLEIVFLDCWVYYGKK